MSQNFVKAIFLPVLVIKALVYLSFQNFLLFHTLVELITILIAFGIAVISFYSRSTNYFFLFLGIDYSFVGGFDLIHTLAYNF